MQRIFAVVFVLLGGSMAAAQAPTNGVVAESWELTVTYTGANGQVFDSPRNVGIYKIYVGGTLVQQWGASPTVGAPAGGFVSNYNSVPVLFTGVVKSFRFKDITVR